VCHLILSFCEIRSPKKGEKGEKGGKGENNPVSELFDFRFRNQDSGMREWAGRYASL
jgi:hypothetical protein